MPPDVMKKIGIFAKIHDPRCSQVAGDLVSWVDRKGMVPLVEERLALSLGLGRPAKGFDIAARADLVVVLGGDGTPI